MQSVLWVLSTKHMFNHTWHILYKYYCYVAALWRTYSHWPWTSLDFMTLPDLNQIPFHSFRIDLEGLGQREHFIMRNLYLCPLGLSLVIKICCWDSAWNLAQKEEKKPVNGSSMKQQLNVKLESETLSAFVISDEKAHIVSGRASKSPRLYEKMINAYLLKHD